MASEMQKSLLKIKETIIDFFTKDFENLLLSHIDDEHTFFYTSGIYKLSKGEIHKFVFVLMGTNPLKTKLGNLEAKYGITPACIDIEKRYQDIAEKVLEGKSIKCSFKTDSNGFYKNPLNYKARIDILEKETTPVAKKEVSAVVKSAPNSYAGKTAVKSAPIKKSKNLIIDDLIEVKIQSKKLKISELQHQIKQLEFTKLEKTIECSLLEKELESLLKTVEKKIENLLVEDIKPSIDTKDSNSVDVIEQKMTSEMILENNITSIEGRRWADILA
jgi:hypothetical protein